MLPVRLVQAYQRLAVVRPSREPLTEVFLSSLHYSNAPERLGHEDIQVREHPDTLVLYYQSVQREGQISPRRKIFCVQTNPLKPTSGPTMQKLEPRQRLAISPS
jgi:hypothetical protein